MYHIIIKRFEEPKSSTPCTTKKKVCIQERDANKIQENQMDF